MFGRKTSHILPGLAEEGEGFIAKPFTEESAHAAKLDSGQMALIRDEFFARLNPNFAVGLDDASLLKKIDQAVNEIADLLKLPLSGEEQRLAATELRNDIAGLGPVEHLMQDRSITDILINGPYKIFAEKNGQLSLTPYQFRDEHHLLSVAKRIAGTVGRRVDESTPMIDARLADGSRVNIIIPPLSVHGTILSIRKFPVRQITLADLAARRAMSEGMAAFLEIAAECRLNILISGGTGAGKTTILNALSGKISHKDRIVTIEDAAEINLLQPHVISLETRQRNVEGSGEVSQRDLLRNALRMRPDRIIIGEVRGPEAHDMLQAMNTGHDGSMSTIHANSPRDALVRVEDLVLSSLANYHSATTRRQIAAALDLVVHVVRDFRGHRYIRSISEVTGLEGSAITMQELFTAEPSHDETGLYRFKQTGLRPYCLEKSEFFGLKDRLLNLLRGGGGAQ